MMNRKIFALSFSLLLLLGCAPMMQNPVFLTGHPYPNPEGVEYAKQRSNALARDGWSYLIRYLNSTQKYDYDFVHAQNNFNYSWSWNPENYNAYWGWGIIRGVQATMTDDPQLAEKYLLQSIEFLSMVPNYNCPVEELRNLDLDLANAYNLAGAFYLQTDEKDKALPMLQEAKKILDEQEAETTPNGRVFYLLAVNEFWQNNFKESMIYVRKAQKIGYPIPDDFMNDLSAKLEESKK